ncbi:MAG: DUF748 domain-containing protein [Thiomicrorhabdus sp.]|nr:DUF748 domain-containing protein [Thiomicrorhabdus sp.]
MVALVKQHKWKALTLLTLASLLLLLPYLLKITAQQLVLDFTKPYGIKQVSLDQVKLNLFKGTISLHQLNLYTEQTDSQKPAKQGVIHIGELSANIKWLGLLQKRIWVQSLYFADTNLPFTLSKQQLLLASIPLTSSSPKESQSNNRLLLLPGLDNVEFRNIHLTLTHQAETTSFNINELNLNHLYAWSNGYGRLKFKGYLNNSLIQSNLQLHLFAPEPKIVGTLKTQQLNISELETALAQLDFDLQGVLDSNITFTLSKTKQGINLFQQGEITISKVGFSQKDRQAKLQELQWHGDLFYNETPAKTLKLAGDLTLKQLQAQQAQQQASLAKATIKGNTTVSLTKTIKVDTVQNLNLLGLKLNNAASQQSLTTDINGKINATVMTDSKRTSVQQGGHIALQNLKANQGDLSAQLAKLNWQGDLNLTSADTLSINSKGSLELKQFALNNPQQQTTIAQTEHAKIDQLSLNGVDSIALQGITVKQLAIANHQKQPGLVTLHKLNLNQANYLKHDKALSVELGKLTIDGSESHLTLDKEGQLTQIDQLLLALGKPIKRAEKTQTLAENKAQQSKQPTEHSNNVHYQIASFNVTGKNPIYLVNEQVKPAIEQTIELAELSLGEVVSQQPHKLTPYRLKVLFDEFSHLSSQGSLSVLTPTHDLNATTKLQGLSLVKLSPLAEHKVGYQITSGQLSAELQTHIKENQIDAQNKLHLNKFSLDSVDNAKTAQLEKGFPIPLKTGLAMLQDKNDNIELSLPIKGDLNKPDFNINDIISTALGGAIAGASRTYLLLALQPFGAIALASEFALDKASAISLQAIDFRAGSANLSQDMQRYLAKIHKLLKERKAIQIKVCGGATEPDRLALQQQAIKAQISKQAQEMNNKQAPQNKIKVPEITIDNTQMLELASERQKAIKRFLIKLGVSSEQVVLCKPEIIKGNSSAQVKLTI